MVSKEPSTSIIHSPHISFLTSFYFGFLWAIRFSHFFLQCSDSCWRLVHIVYYFPNFIWSTRGIIKMFYYRAGYRTNELGFIGSYLAPGMPNSEYVSKFYFLKSIKGKVSPAGSQLSGTSRLSATPIRSSPPTGGNSTPTPTSCGRCTAVPFF